MEICMWRSIHDLILLMRCWGTSLFESSTNDIQANKINQKVASYPMLLEKDILNVEGISLCSKIFNFVRGLSKYVSLLFTAACLF